MKKLLIVSIVVGMLIGAGGCTYTPHLIFSGVVLGSTILFPPTADLPTEQQGAWFIDPNESNDPLRTDVVYRCPTE